MRINFIHFSFVESFVFCFVKNFIERVVFCFGAAQSLLGFIVEGVYGLVSFFFFNWVCWWGCLLTLIGGFGFAVVFGLGVLEMIERGNERKSPSNRPSARKRRRG